jgi:hypothetical protein
MKLSLNIFLLLLFSGASLTSVGQDQKDIPPGKAKQVERNMEGAKPPNLQPNMKKSPAAKSKVKASRKAQSADKKLYAENKKLGREVVFEAGDWIKFEIKDPKGKKEKNEEGKKKKEVTKKVKGKIEKIEPGKITLDETEYLLRDLTSVTPKMFSQFGYRLKGLAKIGLGTPVIAAGGGIIYLSYGLIDPNSPIVIAAAVGATIGAGVVLYGVSFWHKGGKIAFTSRKLKSEKSWRFRAR